MVIEKGDKEWRVGIGGFFGTQGMYFYAKTKKKVYEDAIKSFFNRYIKNRFHKRMTAADRRHITEKKIRMEWIRVWHNADGTLPAWRRKKKR